jgi:hypothetical protein
MDHAFGFIWGAGALQGGAAMARKTTARATTKRGGRRRWSQHVTEDSDALTLDKGVFTLRDPKRIAASLKRSAERSRRRKSDPFRSLHAYLLYQSRRQEVACHPQEDADASQGRVAQTVRTRLIVRL